MNRQTPLRTATRRHLAALALAAAAGAAQATVFTFDTNPLAGSPLLQAPGRQLLGGDLFLPDFRVGVDRFVFSAGAFGVAGALQFANAAATDLPTAANVVVLQTLDNDNNPLTPFGEFQAADLIADHMTGLGAGFFLFHNQALDLNRLVYSTDLARHDADLAVLARVLNPIGPRAVAQLPTFTAADFDFKAAPPATVPEPGGAALALTALALCATAWRRRRAPARTPARPAVPTGTWPER